LLAGDAPRSRCPRRVDPQRGYRPVGAAVSRQAMITSDGQLISEAVITQLGADDEVARLRRRIADWLDGVDDELRDPLSWAFAGTPKHFRPLTLFACHHSEQPQSDPVGLAFAVELMHNMSLIVDDVLDASDERRGLSTVR